MKEILNEILNLTSKGVQDAKQILKLTEEMKVYIEEEEVDALTKCIALRQRWMEQAEDTKKKIQKKIKALYDQYSIGDVDEIDQSLYPEVDKILRDKSLTKDIYKSTHELERHNQGKAESLLEDYKGRIKGIHQGKQAYQAYGRKPTGQSLMFNKVK